jgi:hypothetical protein
MPVKPELYHPLWHWLSRVVREQAGNRCQQCGAANHEVHPVHDFFVKLSVAHKDNNRRHDMSGNLEPVCQRCHMLQDKYHHAYTKKYGKLVQEVQYNLFDSLGEYKIGNWQVCEEDPTGYVKYVAILAPGSYNYTDVLRFSKHETLEAALIRARELKIKFSIKRIKLFNLTKNRYVR